MGLCGGRVFTRTFPVSAGASRCAAAWEGAVLTFGSMAILAEGGASSVTQQAGPFLPPVCSVHPLPLPCTHSESLLRGQTRCHSSPPRNRQSCPAGGGTAVLESKWYPPCSASDAHDDSLWPQAHLPTWEAAVGTSGRWQQPCEHTWSMTSQMWWGRTCMRAKSLSVQLFVNL